MYYQDKIRDVVEAEPSKKRSGSYDYYPFYQGVIGLGVDDLKKNMLMYQKHLQETLVAMKTNPEIVRLEAEKRKYEKPYRDAIKENKDKIKQLKSFVDDSICVSDLENQIVVHTMRCEVEKSKMSEDINVINAKQELKEAKSPFTEAKKVLEIKIAYVNILIEEKGGGLYDQQ